MERARVFVVDSDPELRASAAALRTRGDQVEVFDDAAAVCARADADPPHIVIAELDVAPRGALQLVRDYREAFATRETPFLVVSPHVDDETHIRCLDGGAADYLAKPISPRLLQARVTAILRRSQAMRRSPVARPQLRRSVVELNGRPISIETYVVDGVEPVVRTTVRAGERELMRRQAQLEPGLESVTLDELGQRAHTETEALVRGRIQTLREHHSHLRAVRRLFSDGVEHALAGNWRDALETWEQASVLDPADKALLANIDVAKRKLAK